MQIVEIYENMFTFVYNNKSAKRILRYSFSPGRSARCKSFAMYFADEAVQKPALL